MILHEEVQGYREEKKKDRQPPRQRPRTLPTRRQEEEEGRGIFQPTCPKNSSFFSYPSRSWSKNKPTWMTCFLFSFFLLLFSRPSFSRTIRNQTNMVLFPPSSMESVDNDEEDYVSLSNRERSFLFHLNMIRWDPQAYTDHFGIRPICSFGSFPSSSPSERKEEGGYYRKDGGGNDDYRQNKTYSPSLVFWDQHLQASSRFQSRTLSFANCTQISHSTCSLYCSWFHNRCDFMSRMDAFLSSAVWWKDIDTDLDEILSKGLSSVSSIFLHFLQSFPHCQILSNPRLAFIGAARNQNEKVLFVSDAVMIKDKNQTIDVVSPQISWYYCIDQTRNRTTFFCVWVDRFLPFFQNPDVSLHLRSPYPPGMRRYSMIPWFSSGFFVRETPGALQTDTINQCWFTVGNVSSVIFSFLWTNEKEENCPFPYAMTMTTTT